MNTNTNSVNPVLAFAKNAVIKGTVTGMAEFGFHISVTEVDGAPFAGKVRALLINNQVSGKTDDDRNARIKGGIKMGDTIEGLCTRAEVVDAKNPGLKGKKVAQYAISERALIAKRGRENREAREAVEAAILALPIGTEVVGVVTENRPGLGAFVQVSEGVAAGRRALIHVSQVSDDRNKEDRDEVLAEIEVGTTVTAKISKVARNDKGFLDIGLSLRDTTRQQRAERQQQEADEDAQALRDRFPEGCETTGKNARSTEDGIVVDVADGVEALLVNVDGGMSDSILRCKSTRVRFTNEVRDGRLVVEKA
ncbi:MAG: S1 RNA-binding domain-containing protein [Candidatus Melainabacteria bacterium]|nr:S1 RNA-binding domain-containing protein [Candidatus Melainabacteria bacterium]